MDRRTFCIIAASIVILSLTFASIFNWFQGLGGTGAHAEVYDELGSVKKIFLKFRFFVKISSI